MGIVFSYFCIKSPPRRLIKKTNYKEKSQKQKEQLKKYWIYKGALDKSLINI